MILRDEHCVQRVEFRAVVAHRVKDPFPYGVLHKRLRIVCYMELLEPIFVALQDYPHCLAIQFPLLRAPIARFEGVYGLHPTKLPSLERQHPTQNLRKGTSRDSSLSIPEFQDTLLQSKTKISPLARFASKA